MESLFRWLRPSFFAISFLLFFFTDRYYQETNKFILLTLILFFGIGTLLWNTWKLSNQSKSKNFLGEAFNWWLRSLWMFLLYLSGAMYVFSSYTFQNTSGLPSSPEKAMFGLSLLLFCFALTIGIGVEVLGRNCSMGPLAEPKKLLKVMGIWSLIGFVFSSLTAINYGAFQLNRSYDWTYLKISQPSESTMKLLDRLETPIDIALFYPKDNAVKEYLDDYFKQIKSRDLISLHHIDKYLEPDKAEKYKANGNGLIILSHADKQAKIIVGTQLRKAKKRLKTLDSLFQQAFLKVNAKSKLVFLTTGHGELTWYGEKEKSELRNSKILIDLLKKLNYRPYQLTTKRHGLKEIEQKTKAVIINGATQPFMQNEIDVLDDYLEKGGKALIFLSMDNIHVANDILVEGKSQENLTKFLEKKGIKFVQEYLTSEYQYIAASRTKADKRFLFSVLNAGSHEAVQNFKNYGEETRFVYLNTGYLERIEKKDWMPTVVFKSMRSAYPDKNKNFTVDEKTEFSKDRPIAILSEQKNPKAWNKGGKLVVVANSTMASDALMTNNGNQIFVSEMMKWLTDDNDFSGAPTTEEDIKIEHSRSKELFVFHGSIFLIPFLVLLSGFFIRGGFRRKE